MQVNSFERTECSMY